MITDDRYSGILESPEPMIEGLKQPYPLCKRLGLRSVGYELREEKLQALTKEKGLDLTPLNEQVTLRPRGHRPFAARSSLVRDAGELKARSRSRRSGCSRLRACTSP
ncbi:hypothetical protein K8P10_002995 [Leucobacter sp. Psy1]|nr:hypothetical protein K8P10_002995 [Leucobacter sp. Psy1]